MKKRIFNFLLSLFILFVSVMQANAAINSEYQIISKRNQIQTIANYNYLSMINKNEIIGYRLDSFNMFTSQYRNSALLIVERLNGILSQIEVIKNSSEFSDSDKEKQINALYQDAESSLYDLDARALDYVFGVRNNMPSITYNRFAKKFEEYYNSFQITNSAISVK